MDLDDDLPDVITPNNPYVDFFEDDEREPMSSEDRCTDMSEDTNSVGYDGDPFLESLEMISSWGDIDESCNKNGMFLPSNIANSKFLNI